MKTCGFEKKSLTVMRLIAAAGALIGFAGSAAGAGFSLGTAANYGILIEPGAHSFQLNNSTINGNVGIGSGLQSGGVQIASNGFINGQLRIVDASATVSNPGNVSGGVIFNQSAVTTAINTINSLGTTLGAEAGTALTISGGGQVVNASTGLLDGSGNRVFTIASNGFSNDHTGFSVNGSASDFVVLNIDNGTSNESFGGPISLTGGLLSDHVLFNFVGTGGNLGGSAGGANVAGTFLVPNMKVNVDNINISGRLFGGLAGQDFQTVSGFNLTVPPTPPAVPLPPAVWSGLAVLGVMGAGSTLRRKKVQEVKAL